MKVVSQILIVLGWVVVLLGALGSGVNFTVGELGPVTSGLAMVLAGLTLRVAP